MSPKDFQVLDRWKRVEPREVSTWLSDFAAAWGFAGGHGLDLWLGHATREHGDIDITLFRSDFAKLFSALPGFEFHVAQGGRLKSLRDSSELRSEEWNLWARRKGELEWAFQCLLCDELGGEWVYRRDARIRRPKSELFVKSPEGLVVLAPEVQLLFKSKRDAGKDDFDFGRVRGSLSPRQAAWLGSALGLLHGEGHPWLADLSP